jgi:signal transduction histidine kinase
MYIFEQPKKVNIQNINPYLYNDQYKVILRQFASELKRLLNCIMNELSNLDKEDRLFKNLRNSIKVMTSMIEEIIGIVTFNNNDVPEAETEDFTIRDLLDEVYNIMSSKIKISKLDYIQMITPELENINISSEKSTIKQILLNLLTNAILNTDKGQLKVE